MAFSKALWTLARTTAKGTYKGATAGPIGRTLFGAGIGGIAGFATSDYQSPTLRADAAIRGAMWGGMLGFGTAVGPKLLKAGWKSNLSIGKRLAGTESFWKGFGASPAARLTGGVAKGAFRTGRFMFEHPLLTAGAVGVAGAGMYAAGTPFRSPTMSGAEVDINYNRQAIAAQELQTAGISPMGMVGTAPQMMGQMHRAMARSTNGLVAGLHRGRHG